MNDRAEGTPWLENVLRPVVIAVMVACLAAPFARLLAWQMRGWQGTYLLVFVFLAALEGVLSERLLNRRRITGSAYLVSRASELLVLLLILKVVNYLPVGLGRLWADARSWASDPYSFLNVADLLTALLFVPLWIGALHVGRVAGELDLVESKPSPPGDAASTGYYLWLTQPPRPQFYQESLDRLGELFLWGGILLLLGSAALHFLVPGARALALPLLLYFALGVSLLSQAHFGVVQAGWRAQQIPIQSGIARRWLLWAVLFVSAIALIALLLPTGYAMGPIQAIYYLVFLLIEGVAFVMAFVGFLFALLFWLLSPGRELPESPSLDLNRLPFAPPPSGAPLPAWLDVLVSALFWIAVFGVVAYALFRFLQVRLGLFERGAGAEGTWWGRLLARLRAWWRHLKGWQAAVQERLARRAEQQAEERLASAPGRFFSLHRLPPRELVRYLYLSAARTAARAGQPRRPAQTPYEYQASLRHQFPDVEPDLAGLTDAFVHARYSPAPVRDSDAEAAKSLWHRIKAALRRRR